MCQMSAVCQAHPKHRIARIEQRIIRCAVGLGTAVWLYVDILASKQGLRTFAGDVLHNIHEFTTARNNDGPDSPPHIC